MNGWKFAELGVRVSNLSNTSSMEQSFHFYKEMKHVGDSPALNQRQLKSLDTELSHGYIGSTMGSGINWQN